MAKRKQTISSPKAKRQSNRKTSSETKEIDQASRNTATNNNVLSSTLSSSTSSTLEKILVGGPLLGKRPFSLSGGNSLVGWDTFEPIITPEISGDDELDGSKHQRFILLPHTRYISVLAYKTGVKVATLVPRMDSEQEQGTQTDDGKDSILISCVCLARYRRKLPGAATVQNVLNMMEEDDKDEDGLHNAYSQVEEEITVIVGCTDGSIREFSLKDLISHNLFSSMENFGSYRVRGPIVRARRVIRMEGNDKDSITHVTVPYLGTLVRKDGILTYLTVRKGDTSEVSVEVRRIIIPHFDGSNTNVILRQDKLENQTSWTVDQFKCRVNKSKGGSLDSTMPFAMLSAVRPALCDSICFQGRDNTMIFVVMARMDCISVYCEIQNSNEVFSPVHFKMPKQNPLTAIDIGLNKNDISCGYYKGNIRVMNGALQNVERYHVAIVEAKQLGGENSVTLLKAKSPQSATILSRVHWHALPVSSLVYDSMSYPLDPLLYSGGDECVLVTWQIAQGRDKPVDVQPRLALGGIVHVSTSDRCDDNPANGILVYCEDNTLQLIMSHNKGHVWKVQGLSGGFNHEDETMKHAVSILADPRSLSDSGAQVVITGLAASPGFIHWFDSSKERIELSLEVAPFNRISRNEPNEQPLPSPSVICHSFSKSGDDLITIDEYPTENVFVGQRLSRGSDEKYGFVCTIRFWAWNDAEGRARTGLPYHEIASMAFPHGPKNRISAVSLSQNGSVACTVSFHEKAFRVWEKVSSTTKPNEQTAAVHAYSWSCRYKVTIPSGFSNYPTSGRGVTFSEDGSILAISFGQMVTLWDADEARLLTCHRHMFDGASVDKVEFVNPGLHKDLLLVQSKGGVSLLSPYGHDGSSASFGAWHCSASKEEEDYVVSATTMIHSHAGVAVALYWRRLNRTRLLLLDADTGMVGLRGDDKSPGVVKDIEGCVVALCSTGRYAIQNNWVAAGEKQEDPALCVYALTSNGHLLLIKGKASDDQTPLRPLEFSSSLESNGPKLEMIAPASGDQKRKRPAGFQVGTSEARRLAISRKSALDVFGFGGIETGNVLPSSLELPTLTGKFVHSFVTRALSQKPTQ